MITDALGDFLTRIRNAQLRSRKSIDVPSTKIVESVAKILKKEGFVGDVSVINSDKNKLEKTIQVQLKYTNGQPAIRKLIRISKPGVRVYVGYRNIPRVLNGLGIIIVTTSKGLMTGEEAKKAKIGGEFLCKIW